MSTEEHEAPEERTKEEVFFGFRPSELFDDVFNCAEDYNCNGCDELEKALRKELLPPGGASADDEAKRAALAKDISGGVDNLNNFLAAQIDSNLEKLEVWVTSNVLTVPSAVELDAGFEAGPGDCAGDDDDAELRDMQRRLHAARYVRDRLRRERDAIDAEMARFEQQARDGLEAVRAAGLAGDEADAAAGRVPRVARHFRELRAAGEKLAAMDVDECTSSSCSTRMQQQFASADAMFSQDCAGNPGGIESFVRSMAAV